MLQADLLLDTDWLFQGIANPKRCFIWSALTKTQTQTVSGYTCRQIQDNQILLAQIYRAQTVHRQPGTAGQDRSDVHRHTQRCALAQHCTDILLQKEEADRIHRESRRVQGRVSRYSCDERTTSTTAKWPRGWTFAEFVVLHCST